jgi:glycerol-3-phosphate dehydrogenase (NAD(P)+)
MVMDSKNMFNKVGVIGAGKFGRAVSKLLAQNSNVIIYAHNQKDFENLTKFKAKYASDFVFDFKPTLNIKELVDECMILVPVVPAVAFRDVMRTLSGIVGKHHVIIHGTKGLDLRSPVTDYLNADFDIEKQMISTMSSVVYEETDLTKVGCISGPNLADEIVQGQPAATVIASRDSEVIAIGRAILTSKYIKVYSSTDIIGIEICGVMKNVISIASGCLAGLGYGDNMRGFLMSRAIPEMINVGKFFGATKEAFLGLAGIGDLIATCSSVLSRNYNLGYNIAKGNNLMQSLELMQGDTIEGVKSVKIIGSLVKKISIHAPITSALYGVMFDKLNINDVIEGLMSCSPGLDVDFL